ncbi:hypothetical protein [Thalassobacillus hwangdonensis]|uniref:Uncharacterized protein n=1 Tax=Thalassobacillus hwangdonensis TaxID=546108 RepID=A0ABW3L176_9BACI
MRLFKLATLMFFVTFLVGIQPNEDIQQLASHEQNTVVTAKDTAVSDSVADLQQAPSLLESPKELSDLPPDFLPPVNPKNPTSPITVHSSHMDSGDAQGFITVIHHQSNFT